MLLSTNRLTHSFFPPSVECCWWWPWNPNRNHLQWWKRKSRARTEPLPAGDPSRGQCGNGFHLQSSFGNVSPVWTDLCTPLGVPKVHEEYIPVYPADYAESGTKRSSSKTPKAKKWAFNVCIDTLNVHSSLSSFFSSSGSHYCVCNCLFLFLVDGKTRA